ncbi:MAG: AAA family ATPase [Acidobacteriota bacterium]|nr:AAA family ATPase [Acidobacteriota bacterium]
MQPLPIGIQDFEILRNDGYLYVDKTAHLIELTRGGYFFFSRPRRFGKSLLISTLEAMFQGKRELFDDLALAKSGYDFPSHPILRLDFSTLSHQNERELEQDLLAELDHTALKYGLTPGQTPLIPRLRGLIRELSKQNRVVILVDEYDKPLLDHLEDPESAEKNRDKLREFFGVLKGLAKHVKMLFITGITKFSKVSIFSELNNLLELGIDPNHGSLLGWTMDEIRGPFGDYVKDLAARLNLDLEETYALLEETYNGYCFSGGDERVFNPWSVLNAFKLGRVGNFWFESGSPKFLMAELSKRLKSGQPFDPNRYYDLRIRADMLPSLDIRRADLDTLLFQAGYLTIKKTSGTPRNPYYHLGFPNREVEQSWLFITLKLLAPTSDNDREDQLNQLVAALENEDLDAFFSILRSAFFANIPYELHLPYEKYYQTVFHTLFLLLAVRVRAEESTNLGRIDGVLETDRHIYIFEFKYNEPAGHALQQIRDRNYADKFRARNKKIIGVGIGFGERNITGWEASNLNDSGSP